MTEQEKVDFLQYVRKKVGNLFENFPVPAHGIDHIDRVIKWILKIAQAEKQDIFLAELIALLHDIGRVPEHQSNPEKLSHHELSYILAKEWFAQDLKFDVLSKEEKELVLYAVRYHWDNTADKYALANILRDADKLDMYGEIGVRRAVEFHKVPEKIKKNIEDNLSSVARLKTQIAKNIVEENNLLEPLKNWVNKQISR